MNLFKCLFHMQPQFNAINVQNQMQSGTAVDLIVRTSAPRPLRQRPSSWLDSESPRRRLRSSFSRYTVPTTKKNLATELFLLHSSELGLKQFVAVRSWLVTDSVAETLTFCASAAVRCRRIT